MADIILEVPIKAIPNQQVTCNLNNQQITFDIYLQDESIFCNIYLAGNLIIAGMRATHGSYLNQFPTALNGYLFWWDFDELDPHYQTMGTVSHLLYTNYDALELAYIDWLSTDAPGPTPITGLFSIAILQDPEGFGFLYVDPSDHQFILGGRNP